MAERPGLITSANLPPVPRSFLGRGVKGEAACTSDVGEGPPADRSFWAARENEILLKRVTSALQPATLRATSAITIAFNGEDERGNSTAENMPDSLVHGSHERHEFGLRTARVARGISSSGC